MGLLPVEPYDWVPLIPQKIVNYSCFYCFSLLSTHLSLLYNSDLYELRDAFAYWKLAL